MWKEILARWVWSRQPLDGLVLFPPNHDGSSEAMAREVFHRSVVRLAAIEVYYRQWMLLLASLGFSVVVGGIAAAEILEGGSRAPALIPWYVLLLGSFAGMMALLPWLMTGVVTGEHYDESRDMVARCFLREVPAETPADLRDPWRNGWLAGGGRPVSAEITEADARSMEAQTRASWWVVTAIGVALALSTLSHVPYAAPVVLLLVIFKALVDRHPARSRMAELEAQALVEGNLYLAAGGENWAALAENARAEQVSLAIQDAQGGTPVVTLGTTTGLLAARGDMYAPSGGHPYAFSRTDLHTHLLVFGGTGSGKTSGVLRPLARQMAEWGAMGMVVLDGKGALPSELRLLPGMRVIRPDDVSIRVSLLGELEPEQVVNTIVEIMEGKDTKGDRFFRDAASVLLRRSAVLARAAGGYFWTLSAIGRIAANAEYRHQAVQAAPPELDEDPVFQDAMGYFKTEWQPLDERTRSSVLATAMTWISQITATRELLAWAETPESEDNANILEPLHGGRIGILVPGYRYGRAGAAVTALLKARIYAGLKSRAEDGGRGDETSVVFIIDEAQEVATEDDATMLTIGRSLGLAMVASTQTIEGVEEKLTKSVADKWLNVFGNLVALPGRSFRTDQFVAHRLGKVWGARFDRVEGMNVRDAMKSETLTGAFAASRTQESLRRWIGPALYRMGNIRRGRFTSTLGKLLGENNQSGRSVSSVGVHDLVDASEVGTLLAEPNTALVVGHRARVPRRDVVRLQPEF